MSQGRYFVGLYVEVSRVDQGTHDTAFNHEKRSDRNESPAVGAELTFVMTPQAILESRISTGILRILGCASPRRVMDETKSTSADKLVGKQPSRKTARSFVRLPASMTVGSSPSTCVVFVRDISATGMFLYCDGFMPTYGEHIDLVLEYLQGKKRARLDLSGRVVRVEQPTPTATTGIAIEFDSRHDDLPHSLRFDRNDG